MMAVRSDLLCTVFELTVETVFSAAHAIVIGGVREVVHGHDWRVTVGVAGEQLDADGLLVDFHVLDRVVAEAVTPFRNANLNEVSPFDRVNPTAENVARHLAKTIEAGVRTTMKESAGGARVAWVRVTEAPGCAVTFRL